MGELKLAVEGQTILFVRDMIQKFGRIVTSWNENEIYSFPYDIDLLYELDVEKVWLFMCFGGHFSSI